GLVLVKWWLLVIPHAIIVGIFFGTWGGGWNWGWSGGHAHWGDRWGGPSLVAALVLIAAVGMLFTGRYLRGLFDFVLGLGRWGARVAAYNLRMRGAYPAFRPDLGPEGPGSQPVIGCPAPGLALGGYGSTSSMYPGCDSTRANQSRRCG